MGTKNSGTQQHSTQRAGSQKVQKPAGVFVNSIHTSSEPMFRETVRIRIQPPQQKKSK